MKTTTRVADHLSAITDIAKSVDMQVVYDSGSVWGGRFVIFGDRAFADNYLNGDAGQRIGTSVEVNFNDHGEITTAHRKVRGKRVVNVNSGSPGWRLLLTLQMFT
jgi:hypothetical protein